MPHVSHVAALAVVSSLVACTGEIMDAGRGEPDPAAGLPPSEEPDPAPLGGREPITCDAGREQVGVARVWRLTREQYDNTVRDLLGVTGSPASQRLPPEFAANGFLNNADVLFVRDTEAVQLNILARELAEQAIADRLEQVFPCDRSQLADAACKADFVRGFGRRAFRRTLSDDEVTRYLLLYQAGEEKRDAALGAQAVIEAMLQAPSFLFRSEIGPTGTAAGSRFRLTAYEIATAYSYYFLNTAPDGELLAAAESGQFDSAAGLEKHARRLLELDAARLALPSFLRQLFEYHFLPDAKKDAELFPEFESLRYDMDVEATRFAEHVAFDGTGTLHELLTADFSFASSELAALYGVPAPPSEWGRVQLDARQRAGMLTLPGVMSTLAVDNRTSPVARGKFVRERLLCDHIPDPLPDVDLTVAEPDPGLTGRDLLEAKTSGTACVGCHRLMNPAGFGFESLDAIGRFRAEDNGVAIDSSGELIETRDADGPFDGAAELAAKLARSAQVHECIAIQVFRYALGRAENQGDACAVAELNAKFETAGGNLKELALQVALSDAFLYRRMP
jgi:hypothetical protein